MIEKFLKYDEFIHSKFDAIEKLYKEIKEKKKEIEPELISYFEKQFGFKDGDKILFSYQTSTGPIVSEGRIKLTFYGNYFHEVRVFVIDENNKEHYVCSPFTLIKKVK